ncbi:YheC/YheD family protein [Metabacillus sp. HB246100]
MNDMYSITIVNEHNQVIYLPIEMEAETKITAVSFGTLLLPCTVKYRPHLQDSICLSDTLVKTLHIPVHGKTHVMIHEDTIHLGPLIGIFTAGFTDSSLRPIGERSLFFAKFLSIDHSIGLYAYVFGAHHINWEEGTVEGFTYGKSGWTQKTFPLPNVVYDRLPNRRIENHQALKLVKKRLIKEYSIPWYNPGFFNKWSVHQLLINDQKAAKYLPDTVHTPSISKMEEMLSAYQSIYLKPVNGSLGLGVFQLMYSKEENIYYSRYRDENETNRLRKYPSLEHFLKASFKKRLLSSYLAQQGIKLIRLDGKAIDFRIHTNKDEYGEWKVTAIAAKVAGRGSVTTHLNNGGVVKTLEEIFDDPQQRLKALHDLTEAAILLSERIDSHIKGSIGEIGFDFGIDQNSRIWMFEANSKPGRSIFAHPELKEADLLSRKSALQFGHFLTKQAIYHPEDLIDAQG